MTEIRRTALCLAFTLLGGCSLFQAEPEPQACAPVEQPACPVCPGPEPLQCPEPQVIEKIVTVPAPAPAPAPANKARTAGKMNLPVVGAVEWASIEPGDIRLEARIDTGTDTTVLHAENIQLTEKDGKRWVNFTIYDPAHKEPVQVEQRLRRKVKVKQGDTEKQSRYVVQLWITVGKVHSLVDVMLTDADRMEYPLIIGRNMLIDTMIVDVSDRHTTK
jgi:hypothetical protein